MTPNLLVLGGTTEARMLAPVLVQAGFSGTFSLAGRVARPADQALPMRVGGFGGVAGLIAYLRDHHITHVIDATHPFAAQMSRNAVAACEKGRVPLTALTRAPWVAQSDDNWIGVPDIAGAVNALDRPATRVLLAVGRMHLPDFAVNPQHEYLLRLVDPPETPPDFPRHRVIVDRGPFTVEDDLAMLRDHGIQLLVSKNSGGSGASAKIEAARTLNLPIIMIDRPAMPPRHECHSIPEVMQWLGHSGADPSSTDLGV